MPCVELFEQQPKAYQEKIIPKEVTKVIALEFSNDYVWYKFVGKTGLLLGFDNYNLSENADAIINYKYLYQT
ncbi:transketolase-like TK C-terminal-containing protein [Spiroplasma endosymbiont of Polydrusus formosus]|uniref:transketolase-like TK C-terminal-containing protein n=1 Tax=Spiroplasma endosymbiont of Polydrusus formosus TaxID=3139326 RepID=UPI0035B55F2C